MADKFRCMLAVACEDTSKIKYPVYVSTKADGIRVTIRDGKVFSRSNKLIPSKAVQEKFGKDKYNGFDGELIYNGIFDKDVFSNTTSFCMSHEVPEGLNKEDILLYVFDRWDMPNSPYDLRYQSIVSDWDNGVFRLQQELVHSNEDLLSFEEAILAKGGEGVMVRSIDGKYKNGRSNLKEGYLLKVKRFTDLTAKIIGFVERQHNQNEAKVSETGYTKRSTSKEGMVGANTLGALKVWTEEQGFGEFEVGTGFDDTFRKEIWDNRDKWLGKLVNIKYFSVGVVDKPRFPVYLSVRADFDI